MNEKIPSHAIEILWNYMQMHQLSCSSDALIVLGSIDDRVARGQQGSIVNMGNGTVIVTGGAVERNSRKVSWKEPTEAEHFMRAFQDSNTMQD